MDPVQWLRLHQFRCHAELAVELGPRRNYFCGENGRGKTSVLEALYAVSRLRSFRTASPRELCLWGADVCRAEARAGSDHRAVTWKNGERRLEWNRQPVERAGEFWGRIPVVLMAPQDKLLVGGPGAHRRQWMDALIAQCQPDYMPVVQRHARLLTQRNAALRQTALDRRMVQLLAEQITPPALEITRRRREMSSALTGWITAAFHDIMGGPQEVIWQYRPNVEGDDVDWARVEAQEFSQKITLTGPQRDDWKFAWSGHNLARFGSEGQQRIAAVSLRLAEARFIRESRGAWPVFLLDDVANTLDPERRERFAAAVPEEAQVLIALPEVERPAAAREGDRVWRIEPGNLQPL